MNQSTLTKTLLPSSSRALLLGLLVLLQLLASTSAFITGADNKLFGLKSLRNHNNNCLNDSKCLKCLKNNSEDETLAQNNKGGKTKKCCGSCKGCPFAAGDVVPDEKPTTTTATLLNNAAISAQQNNMLPFKSSDNYFAMASSASIGGSNGVPF